MSDLKIDVEAFIETQQRNQQEKLVLEAKLTVAKEKLDESKAELTKHGFANLQELNAAKDKIEADLRDILQKAGI